MTLVTTALDAVDLGSVFNFSDYGELVRLLQNSLYAGAALGLVGGLVSTIVMARDLPFAVHGISEMSFAGAAGALLVTGNVVAGSLVGAIAAAGLIGILGMRSREHNSVLGVLMPFGLGLGILFLSLYHGRAANKFGLLTGQIVAIDQQSLMLLLSTCAVVGIALVLVWRPLMFASFDREVAATRGVPVRLLGFGFIMLLGLVVAVSIQIIGALLVLALLCTPAAAAGHVTASPLRLPLLSAGFGFIAMVGGTFLALGTTIPISPYVTTISFLIYLVCRTSRWVRERPRRAVDKSEVRVPDRPLPYGARTRLGFAAAITEVATRKGTDEQEGTGRPGR
jgi:zinc/manganese transport system permease protein